MLFDTLKFYVNFIQHKEYPDGQGKAKNDRDKIAYEFAKSKTGCDHQSLLTDNLNAGAWFHLTDDPCRLVQFLCACKQWIQFLTRNPEQ